MKTINLECGFLFLYDWLPLFKKLSPEGHQEVFWALIDHQRTGAPMPDHFKDPMSETCFEVISPAIQRRLKGQKGGKKTAEIRAQSGGTLPRIEEKRREENSVDERSGITRECAHECARACDAPSQDLTDTATEVLPPSYVPPAASAAPSPTEKKDFSGSSLEKQDAISYDLTDRERQLLLSKGIPLDYIEKRQSRANERAPDLKMSAYQLLLSWWHTDRASVFPSPPDASPLLGNSFNTDEFFSAAIARSEKERLWE